MGGSLRAVLGVLWGLVGGKPNRGRRKRFFFEKKKQKTFDSSRLAAPMRTLGTASRKSLLVLFFRKERLPPANAFPPDYRRSPA
jgi:hypothetical protein